MWHSTLKFEFLKVVSVFKSECGNQEIREQILEHRLDRSSLLFLVHMASFVMHWGGGGLVEWHDCARLPEALCLALRCQVMSWSYSV